VVSSSTVPASSATTTITGLQPLHWLQEILVGVRRNIVCIVEENIIQLVAVRLRTWWVEEKCLGERGDVSYV